MRRLALALLLLAGPVFAQSLPPGVSVADRASIQGVIGSQMQAFQRDDGPGAYAFAAPNVRQVFPTADVFLDMVRRGYAPVYRPKQTEFTALALCDGDIVQEVELVGPDGRPVTALYTMVKDEAGAWKIAACVLTESKRVGV